MTAQALTRFSRPATLPAPLAGVLGGAVAASSGWPRSGAELSYALVSALLLTVSSNGMNQLADVETDRINRPERPLPSGAMSPRQAWGITIASGALAVAAALLVNRGYLACVLLTIPVTAAYSFRPVRTKRVPFLANATIATPRGLLLVTAGWAAGGGFSRPEAWILGSLFWLYVFGASSTKDFGDIEGDRATGCLTLPLWWGPKAAARFVAPFLVLPFLLEPLFAAAGWLPRGVLPWLLLGGGLGALGLAAGALLLKDPLPPADGSPHPAWKLMYLQLTAAHLGTAVLFWATK